MRREGGPKAGEGDEEDGEEDERTTGPLRRIIEAAASAPVFCRSMRALREKSARENLKLGALAKECARWAFRP